MYPRIIFYKKKYFFFQFFKVENTAVKIMRSFTNLIVLVILAYSKAQVFNDISKEWLINKPSFLFYDRQLTRNPRTFIHATCNYFKNSTERDCNFVLSYLNSADDDPNNLTCSNYFIAAENRIIKNNFKMESLGEDSVVFSWSESDNNTNIYEKINIIHMSSCEVTYTKEIYRNLNNNRTLTWMLVTYNNAIEIIDYNNESCGLDVCKTAYDNEKNLESYSTIPGGNLTFLQLIPLNRESLSNGYFAFSYERLLALIVYYVDKIGNIRHIMTLPAFAEYNIAGYARGKFGLCYYFKDSAFKCAQLDTNANLLLNKQIDVKQGEKILAVHNLKEGGFLLLVGSCTDPFDTFSCDETRGIYINSDGVLRKVNAPRPVFNCQRIQHSNSLRIFQTSDGFCFYYSTICLQENTGSRTIKFSRKCSKI